MQRVYISLWLWELKISVYTWESAWRMMKYVYAHYCIYIMTSSNGNIFHITSLLCGEFTGDRWIPYTKASDAELWCFLWSAPEPTVEQTMETPVIWDAIVLIMMSLWCIWSIRVMWITRDRLNLARNWFVWIMSLVSEIWMIVISTISLPV